MSITEVDHLREVGNAHSATVAQLAGAWVLDHPAVQIAIVRAHKPEHFAESIGALDLTLTDAVRAEIDRVMAAAARRDGRGCAGLGR